MVGMSPAKNSEKHVTRSRQVVDSNLALSSGARVSVAMR